MYKASLLVDIIVDLNRGILLVTIEKALIIVAGVIILVARLLGLLLFKGENITSFLKRYSNIYKDL